MHLNAASNRVSQSLPTVIVDSDVTAPSNGAGADEQGVASKRGTKSSQKTVTESEDGEENVEDSGDSAENDVGKSSQDTPLILSQEIVHWVCSEQFFNKNKKKCRDMHSVVFRSCR